MADIPVNIWQNSWGNINNYGSSNPPSGWSWNEIGGTWIYSGVLPPTSSSSTGITTTPTNATIYQTSSVDCFPDVVINTTGDPVNPPTGTGNVHIPGTTAGTTTPTLPAPPVSNPIGPVPTFGHIYNVCFDDGLLNQKGWTRARYEGTKLRSLYYNEYTDAMDEGKEAGPIQNANLETSIDGLQFIITGSHDIAKKGQNKVGNPFEKLEDCGITKTLFKVSAASCRWENEFNDNYNGREKYPPKHLGNTTAGINATYQQSNKSLPNAPFGPKIYDVPLVPTTYYKINDYTQLPEKIERKPNTFDLIPTPIKLHPIDPEGLNGGPTLLGTDPGQNEQHHLNTSESGSNLVGGATSSRLSSEHQIRHTEREYVWDGPWSYTYVDDNGISQTVSGNATPSQDSTWGYNETQVSRSAIIPEKESVGDITYGKTPVIENYSNAIFFGNTVYGYQQSDVFPGPGPDYSYIKLEKAYVFNSDDDSFFVQEIKSEGEDRSFQNFMQSTFPWATDFRIKLLDYEQENNLKTSYGTHWNRGYFSEIATYTTESANRTSSGHYPGTGKDFVVGDGRYIDGTGNSNLTGSAGSTWGLWNSLFGSATPIAVNAAGDVNEGAQFRKTPTGSNDGGYYYMSSNNGGGEGALLTGGFKTAGMQFGLGELDFPQYQQSVAPGNWDTGPGTSNFFGMDPLPGGMRYYTFKFFPVHRPVTGMSANNSSVAYNGRVLSGTFEINEKNTSTDWWFRQGGKKEILWVSESCAGDVSQSMKVFMDDVYKRKNELYILTFNESKFVDKSFNQSFLRQNHDYLKRTTSDIPGYPGNPALNFADATFGEDDNTGSYSYYTNFVRPLNTFGSVLYNDDPSQVGVKNAHNLIKGGAPKVSRHDYSAEAIAWTTANTGSNSGLPQNDPNHFGVKSGKGPMGGMWFGGINAPRFMNGGLFVETGDPDGTQFINDSGGTQSSGSMVNGTWVYDSVSVWTGYQYGNNWTSFYTGTKYINFKERKGWPGLNKWTISKLEEKPNFLLTDLNKTEELPQGVGSKGFILIPDTLNPRIKANLDFYLAKAGLLTKEKAPKYKDRSIKKHTYLAPRIRLKKRKRRGWFWKLRKRIKGKDY